MSGRHRNVAEIADFASLESLAAQQRVRVHEGLVHLAVSHPDWIKTGDARSTCLQSLWNVARYAELSLHQLGTQLIDPSYWEAFRGPTYDFRQTQFELMAYSQCAKSGVFHLTFAAVENSHRSFLRALDPHVAASSRGEYKSIYEALLRGRLGASEEDLALLDLLRLVRNTIHNEGVHRPRLTSTATVAFKGIEYVFEDGKPIEFVTWQFVLDRLGDLMELQGGVVRHPILVAIGQIPDASAEPLPVPPSSS